MCISELNATRCGLKERRLPAAGGRPNSRGAWKAPLRLPPTRGVNSESTRFDWGPRPSTGSGSARRTLQRGARRHPVRGPQITDCSPARNGLRLRLAGNKTALLVPLAVYSGYNGLQRCKTRLLLNIRKQRLWFLGLFLFFCRLPAFEATVVLVVSGDSLVVETAPPQKRYRIHLAGIDAPEMPKGSLQGQPFAVEARTELNKISMGSTVSVLVEKAHEYDGHYAILIAKNGICINTYMVESGLAVLTGIDDRYYNLKLEDSCNFARQNRWGIWSLARLETPFEYRQRTKKRHLD